MTHTKSKVALAFATLLSMIGLVLSVYLTWHFFQTRIGIEVENALCDLSPRFNCSAVAVSKSAEIFGRLPVSLLATLWFMTLLLMSLFAKSEKLRSSLLRVMALGSVVALLASVAYLGIMFFVLNTYCAFCLGIDVVNIAIFAVLFTITPNWKGSWFEQWKTVAILIFASFIATAALAKVLMVVAEPSVEQIDALIQPVLASPVIEVMIPADSPRLGNPNAPVQIVEFADFECPHCRLAALTMHTLLERYPDKIQLIFRNLPFDGSCNKMMEGYTTRHKSACEAAKAALCANRQGRFKGVYENLFENQLILGSSKIEQIAVDAGVDRNLFAACKGSPEIATALSADIDEAIALKIEGTPTFFVNGHKTDSLPLAAWEALLKKLLGN